MAVPQLSTVFTAPVVSGVSISVGDLILPSATTPGEYVAGTTANRGSRRVEGIAITAIGSNLRGSVQIQSAGTIDKAITGLGAGTLPWIRCSVTGRMERCVPAIGDDIVGYAEPDGRVHLCPGVLDYAVISGGGLAPGSAVGDIPRWDGSAWAPQQGVDLPAGAVPGDLVQIGPGPTLVRVLSAAGTAPADGDVVTYSASLGKSIWSAGGGGGGASLDPASIAMTILQRASYSNAASWVGTASTGGTSGAKTFDSGARPSNGTAVNGYVPAVFNGSSQFLGGSSSSDQVVAQGAYTFGALLRIGAYPSAQAGAEYNLPAIIQDAGGNWGLSLTEAGVCLYHNDTAAGVKSRYLAVALNTWVFVAGVWDGTDIRIYGNGVLGAVGPLDAINLNAAHEFAAVTVGKNFASSAFCNMQLLEVWSRQVATTATQLANIKTHYNTRYALSL